LVVAHIKCDWGNERLALHPTHTVKKLLMHYCKKKQKEDQIHRLKLSFDGEIHGPETTVEELDLENGDQIDLIVSP